VRPGQPFGNKYLYKGWIKACENLGVEGLDLYGGTRHTTTTELAKRYGREAAMANGFFPGCRGIDIVQGQGYFNEFFRRLDGHYGFMSQFIEQTTRSCAFYDFRYFYH
jgi:hypothetical protein